MPGFTERLPDPIAPSSLPVRQGPEGLARHCGARVCYPARSRFRLRWCALAAFAVIFGAGCGDDDPTGPESQRLELTSVQPGRARVGSDGMELVLRGTGFRQNAVVGWNGEERITSFTNSEQLVVTLSDLDFQTAGEMELRVLNPGASEPNVVSNAIVFPVRHGFGSPELEVVVP